jgi:4-amino-4-deoxy-L-arabinose transferase-like glycosyltransferase
MISLTAYAPFMGWWWLTGSLKPTIDYPYGFADIYQQLGLLLLIRRLVTAAMALVGVWLAWKIVMRLTKSRFAAATAALALLLNYHFLAFSKTGNVDIPMIMWLLATLYCWLRALEQAKMKWYVWTAIFSALALATKDVAVAVVVPMALLLGVVHFMRGWRSNTRISRIIFHRSLVWAGIIGFVVYGFSSLFFFYPHQLFYRLALFSGSGWGVAGYDQGNWLVVLGRTLWMTGTTMSWPLFALGVLGLVWAVASRRWLHASLTVPLVGYYIINIGRIGFVFDRHVLPIAMILAISAGLAVAYLSSMKRIRTVTLVAALLILLYAALVSTTAITQMSHDSRYALEDFVKTLPSSATIETFDVSTWQPRYGLLGRSVTVTNDVNVSRAGLLARAPDYVIVNENTLKSRFAYRGLQEGQATLDALFSNQLNYTLDRTFGNTTVLFAPPRDPDQFAVQRIDPLVYVFKRD